MGRDNEIIMVIDRKKLFKNDYFEGFIPHNKKDFESRILKYFKWLPRKEAEHNSDYKQPIAYTIILNDKLRTVFGYQRASEDKKYSEKRLQGKFSIGIGGHIDKTDRKSKNVILTSFKRELKEEIDIIGKIKKIEPLGYINNDSDDVGKVHFGILYLLKTNARIIIPGSEIKRSNFKTIKELEEICSDHKYKVEEWTKIAFNPLKKYVKNL